MNLKQKLKDIETALNEFMSQEYGPEAWAELDGVNIDCEDLAEDPDYLLIYFKVRGGFDAEHNAFEKTISLPTNYEDLFEDTKVLDAAMTFLRGYVAALAEANM